MFHSCSTKSYNKRFIYFTFITLAVLERISEGPGTIIRRLEGRRELLDDPFKSQIHLTHPTKFQPKWEREVGNPKTTARGTEGFRTRILFFQSSLAGKRPSIWRNAVNTSGNQCVISMCAIPELCWYQGHCQSYHGWASHTTQGKIHAEQPHKHDSGGCHVDHGPNDGSQQWCEDCKDSSCSWDCTHRTQGQLPLFPITLTDQVPMAQGIYNCPSDAIANQSHYTHHNCIRVNAAIDHLYENSDKWSR